MYVMMMTKMIIMNLILIIIFFTCMCFYVMKNPHSLNYFNNNFYGCFASFWLLYFYLKCYVYRTSKHTNNMLNEKKKLKRYLNNTWWEFLNCIWLLPIILHSHFMCFADDNDCYYQSINEFHCVNEQMSF